MIFRLNKQIIFPDPALAEADGLLAVGGDLCAERLLLAYRNGIFPWYSNDTPILWYSPHERFVLYPDKVHISKSMRRLTRSGTFQVTYNQCFGAVIRACSAAYREGQDGTWITRDMIDAYVNLHQLGHAHSVEVWQDNGLVGGLYGIAVGSVFCGESMFSKVSNTSKLALIWLCQTGLYQLIDCQMPTEHFRSLGAGMISREAFMSYLAC